MTTLAAGIHSDISAEQYHADPCPAPSLSSTIAKALITKSPKHAWLAHPKLGGWSAAPRRSTDEMRFGSLVHRLILGVGAQIVEIDAEDWRGKAARDARNEAESKGHIPALKHEFASAMECASAGKGQLVAMGHRLAYQGGLPECVIMWQEEGGVWCRAMIDHLVIDEKNHTAHIRDIKTVSRSSHPAACAAQIHSLGYDLSLAFYKRGLAAVRPDLAGRITCSWDFLETEPPYALTPAEITAEWNVSAALKVDRAIDIWRRCIALNHWPYYVNDTVRLEPKPWMLETDSE